MVVRAALARYRIVEVPTRLRPDGRSRPPHLRTWRDGWRHLRFLLFYSPRWLFLYPGLALCGLGALLVLLLARGPLHLGPVTLDLHTLMGGCLFLLAGMQAVAFALISRQAGIRRGYLPPIQGPGWLRFLNLETGLLLAGAMLVTGLGGMAATFGGWAGGGFGDIADPLSPRLFLVSSTVAMAGLQAVFTAFLASILEAGEPPRG
jgi:hypothetical protein